MTVSVVVTTWGVDAFVPACRASLEAARRALAASPYSSARVEIAEIRDGSGVSAARNAGLAAVSGDYVWFVDGDDLVREDAFVSVVRAIVRHPGVDIVHFDLARLDSPAWREPAGAAEKPVRFYALGDRRARKEAYRRHARWILASTAVYRLDFARRMRFEPLVKAEDSLWGRRAFYAAASLARLDAALYGYRARASGADRTHDAAHDRDAARAGFLMLADGLRVPGLRLAVVFDWLRYRFRDLPAGRHFDRKLCYNSELPPPLFVPR